MIDILQIANTCHEANRVLQAHFGDEVSPPWHDAPGDIQRSAMMGVHRVMQGQGPRELHESWMESKIAEGWKYGLKKDYNKKTHPCIVPYDELPDDQKIKDDMFLAVVKSLTT